MGWIRRETEKGTTQYICPNCHDYHEFREDFGEQTFNENFIFCRRCGARNGTGTAPTLTPPNEPLTWNELGNMVEKPVYIVELEDGESCWVLVHTIDDIKALFVSAFDQYDYGNRELYGQTWLAYRRPPEVSP